MKSKKLAIATILVCSFLSGRTQYMQHDTLYKRYILDYEFGVGKYHYKYEKDNKIKIDASYYLSEDSLINGELFFGFGLCVPAQGDPFYFMKVSYAPIFDNSFYENNKEVKIELTLANTNRTSLSDTKRIITLTSPIKGECMSQLTYMGMSLKCNCNIFKFENVDWQSLSKYDIIDYKISGGGESISGGGMFYIVRVLIDRIKNIDIRSF